VWEILWDGMFLMSSESRASEHALGALAKGRTLIGGLGMGFTLRAALDRPDARAIEVVEISDAVVGWNRELLAPLAGAPLADPRVCVHVADLQQFLDGDHGLYDRILLDVDNGPSWARPENEPLYDDDRLERLRASLAPGGALAVWSAQAEPAFLARLGARFALAEERAIPVVLAGRPSTDYLYIGVLDRAGT
jgi:spermidine synthase